MRALLDTHALLWAVALPERLGSKASACLLDPDNELYVSIASLWEVGIKISLGRLDLGDDWADTLEQEMKENGIRWVPLSPAHCRRVAGLPFHHRDPFDRMLVAQALEEGMTLVSRDGALDAYGVGRVW